MKIIKAHESQRRQIKNLKEEDSTDKVKEFWLKQVDNIKINTDHNDDDFMANAKEFPNLFDLDSEEHIKMREEKLKFRNLMLDNVKQKIEMHRLSNMQRLSRFQFDQIGRPSNREGEEKISWIHS